MANKAARLWLMKSESSVYSIEDLRRDKTTGWEGVRNFEARNFMRAMAIGDLAFFYHSNSEPSGIAGIMEICKAAYPDPSQFDRKDVHFDPKASADNPIWQQVDVRFKEAFPRVLSLEELRAIPELKDTPLFKRSRLSIQPIDERAWQAVIELQKRRLSHANGKNKEVRGSSPVKP